MSKSLQWVLNFMLYHSKSRVRQKCCLSCLPKIFCDPRRTKHSDILHVTCLWLEEHNWIIECNCLIYAILIHTAGVDGCYSARWLLRKRKRWVGMGTAEYVRIQSVVWFICSYFLAFGLRGSTRTGKSGTVLQYTAHIGFHIHPRLTYKFFRNIKCEIEWYSAATYFLLEPAPINDNLCIELNTQVSPTQLCSKQTSQCQGSCARTIA